MQILKKIRHTSIIVVMTIPIKPKQMVVTRLDGALTICLFYVSLEGEYLVMRLVELVDKTYIVVIATT